MYEDKSDNGVVNCHNFSLMQQQPVVEWLDELISMPISLWLMLLIQILLTSKAARPFSSVSLVSTDGFSPNFSSSTDTHLVKTENNYYYVTKHCWMSVSNPLGIS